MSDWGFPRSEGEIIDYSMTITMSANEAMESALFNRGFEEVGWAFFRDGQKWTTEQERREEQAELDKLPDRDYLIQHKGYEPHVVDAFFERRQKRRDEKAEQDRINALWRNRVKRAWAESKDRVSVAYRVLRDGRDCDCGDDDF